jgi:hypothetical protein
MLLNVIYWVLVVLLVLACFGPAEYLPHAPVTGIIQIILFVCIGLRSFRTPIT